MPVDQLRTHALDQELKLKDPASAAAMSMIHAGLGQIYNGDIAKGIALIASKIASLIAAIVIGINENWAAGIAVFVIAWGGLWVFGIWDAYQSASQYNRRISTSSSSGFSMERNAKERSIGQN